jgi:hypothetical protein
MVLSPRDSVIASIPYRWVSNRRRKKVNRGCSILDVDLPSYIYHYALILLLSHNSTITL